MHGRSRALELKARLDRGDRLVVLDVREPQEYQINRIDGSVLIPLGELAQRYGELDPVGGDRGAVQVGHAQREGRGLPARRRASG